MRGEESVVMDCDVPFVNHRRSLVQNAAWRAMEWGWGWMDVYTLEMVVSESRSVSEWVVSMRRNRTVCSSVYLPPHLSPTSPSLSHLSISQALHLRRRTRSANIGAARLPLSPKFRTSIGYCAGYEISYCIPTFVNIESSPV